jgi:hypothetical protein
MALERVSNGGSYGPDLLRLEFAQIQQMNDSSSLNDLMPKQAQWKLTIKMMDHTNRSN